jgi:hypothetical protein
MRSARRWNRLAAGVQCSSKSLFELHVGAIEQDRDLDFLVGTLAQRGLQAGQRDELEALGEGEVFLQQPVALEAALAAWQQRFFFGEAQRAQRALREQAVPRGRTRDGRDQHAFHAAQQAFQDPHRHLVGAAQVQLQGIEGQVLEGGARAFQAQAHAGLDRRRQLHVQAGLGAAVGEEFRFDQLDRPQGQVVRAAVLAGGIVALAQHAAHAAPARHQEALLQGRVGQVGLELDHRHRRRGRQQVRVDQFGQVLGKAGKLGVDLHLHARGHEAEAFQQALDVRVGALETVQTKAPGDLREFGGELAAHFTQVLQLLAVIAKETRIQLMVLPLSSDSSTEPRSRSISVFRYRRSG